MVDTPMPLTAHLAELRQRLIWCLLALCVGFIVCYAFSDKIVAALQSPPTLVGPPVKVPLQIIAPAEAFMTYMKVGLIAGLFVASYALLMWRGYRPSGMEGVWAASLAGVASGALGAAQRAYALWLCPRRRFGTSRVRNLPR